MDDNRKLLLLHKSMESKTLSENVDIMLTPQFYTLKKEILPMKFAYQAKKIAASIFEGMLEESRIYDYFVFKQGDYWVFIAYSLEEIMEYLKSKNLPIEHISKLFFFFLSVAAFEKPYLLNDKEVLAVLDDTVVVMPKSAVEGEVPKTALNITKPTRGISLERAYASVLNFKDATVLAVVLILFSVLFIVEGIRYGEGAQVGMDEFERLIQANPSLESQYKRESIFAKYKKIDTIEKKKREIVKALGSMLTKGVELQSLHIDDKGFSAHFVTKENRAIKRVESKAKKAKFTFSKVANGIKIEGQL